MLQVELNHIVPENDAYARIREIIDHVEQEKEVYVITKDGRPVVAIVNVDLLDTTQDAFQKPQSSQMESLFNLNPAPSAAEDVPPTPTPLPTPPTAADELPEPMAAPAQVSVPDPTPTEPAFAPLPPLPPLPSLEPVDTAPVTVAQPIVTPLPSAPIQQKSEYAPLPASNSPLDEPLPPLSGTEHLNPEPPTSAPVSPLPPVGQPQQ